MSVEVQTETKVRVSRVAVVAGCVVVLGVLAAALVRRGRG